MKYKMMMALSVGLFLAAIGNAQVFEREKTVSRSYAVQKETTLEISNKYGNIHLFTWKKDSVRIIIKVDVKANKQSKADNIFEYIDFDFSHTKYYIIANTQLRSNKGSFWSEVTDLANTIFSGNNRAQINYDVYLPAAMEVKLENKFGNIYFSDFSGKTTIKLSNGDLKANDFSAPTSLHLSFGNASIHSLQKGEITASYADIELNTAQQLEVESKSSTFQIHQLDVLKLDSRRDKINIDQLSGLTGSTSFTYLTVKDFSGYIQLSTSYGELSLEDIHANFHLIELDAAYSDINLSFPESLGCDFKVMHTSASSISFPDHFKTIHDAVVDEKADQYKLSGRIGEQANGKGKIDINLKAGKLVLRNTLSEK